MCVIVFRVRILQVKCFKYWPDRNDKEVDFEVYGGMFVIKYIDEIEFEDYIIREMELSYPESVSVHCTNF